MRPSGNNISPGGWGVGVGTLLFYRSALPFVVRLDDHRRSRTSTSCGEPRRRVLHPHTLAPSLLHQLRSELSQIY